MAVRRAHFLLCLSAIASFPQQLGLPPPTSLDSTDLTAAYGLPPLRDRSTDTLERIAAQLKVVARAHALGLSGNSATEAWARAQNLLHARESKPAAVPGAPIAFNGTKASDLNRLLADPNITSVYVASANLTLDEPVRLGHNGITLDLGAAALSAAAGSAYLLRLENISHVMVSGGVLTSGQSGVLINECSQAGIVGMELAGLSGSGIVVTHSSEVTIARNRFIGVSGAPVIFHGGTYSSVAERNEISGSLGWPNMSAGIVITDRNVDVTAGPATLFGPDGYRVVSQPMLQRLNPPHDNVIIANHITTGNSSGVYLDGAVANVIAGNTIERNAKEGLCLDNGSASKVVTGNQIQQNGQRWGEPDNILANEFVAHWGRLADGTAAAKVPGISIDNAIYNVVYSNTVAHNFGGGIKMVRTGYHNLIGLNTLIGNNDGGSAGAHFFGIELGAAALDSASDELDGTPSRGNILFSNLIRGNHYSGIFFGDDSDQNDVFDNVIMDAAPWALESSKPMPNNSLNNLTNLPSRNIGSGLPQPLAGPVPGQ